ncbi:MAG TPA: Hsp33 family molecular chaperone [Caulobacteraceae bacterium]|nr:Hsp33 family molecular chaperone [Caulobacteraceae bacterium]
MRVVSQRTFPLDDLAAPFQIDHQPVRGRLVRMGAVVDEVLTRHDYPAPVANLLGETCALAALVGSSLKFEGRLIVQAQGDGPVSYVVADYDTEGLLRGYCRYDEGRLAEAAAGAGLKPLGAKALLGEGVFIMTIDQGADMERYQGVTPIEGETLALCAERYFAQSEQTPTRVRLAVGQADAGEGPKWRAGGVMLQNIAEDEARGATAEAWREAQFLFETIGEDELIDPSLSPETLLYRLFHEQGVRLFPARPLKAFCRCSEERILSVLKSFGAGERADMIEPDGRIHVTCEYCSRTYEVEPAAVG